MFKNFFNTTGYLAKKIVTSRLFVVMIVLCALFAILIHRLFVLQIVNGEEYQESYTEQTVKEVSVDYTRGTIYDKNGNVLAYNKLAYTVQITDDNSYDSYQRNDMILKLIDILDKHGETINSVLSLAVDDSDDYVFTTTTDTAKIRFLKDVYGDDDFDKAGKDASDYTPDEVVQTLINRYKIGYRDSKKQNTYDLDKKTTLKILNIRYALALNSYTKYIPSTVASDVSDETVSDIMEHEYELNGVTVEQESVREYNDSVYFAHIIGYTGSVSADELASLKEDDENYEAGDIVGKSGVEYSMEDQLKGTKGSKTICVDNQGTLLDTLDETQAQAGNDVYLTIDKDLQIAVYKTLEQHLAGVLVSKIVNYSVEITSSTVSSEIEIPVTDVYFQLINNNILSMNGFAAEDASDIEKDIYSKFLDRKQKAIDRISKVLLTDTGTSVSDYSDETKAYIDYAYSMLQDDGIILKDNIDTSDSIYTQWQAQSISFHDFLMYGLTNGWIDVTKLNLNSKYSNSDESFKALAEIITTNISSDSAFNKQVYKYMIKDGTLTGRELCLALFDQNILAYNKDDYNGLLSNGELHAYNFIKDKISKIEITPAQLALDPCSGSVVVTDVNTGKVLALVSYPSYDNNKITVDSSYLNELNNDLSSPLYSRATQTKVAPGSIFKMVTAFAGMEENVLQPSDTITTASDGIFNKSNIQVKCHISPGNHGTLGIAGALEKSCNYFFCEVGYRLSLNSAGNYNANKGLANIQKYSGLFGFDEKSGIEISEASPHITDEDPVQSSIGQGSHAYTNTQINRYITAVANKGKVLDLNLVNKITTSDGEKVKTYKTDVIRTLGFSNDEWDVVWKGMHNVVYNSEKYTKLFKDCSVTVAGKTGTAQEDKKRGNHANFVCFAPYDNPEIAVSVSIPFGYTAANSVNEAADVVKYYFGDLDLKTIMSNTAATATSADANE